MITNNKKCFGCVTSDWPLEVEENPGRYDWQSLIESVNYAYYGLAEDESGWEHHLWAVTIVGVNRGVIGRIIQTTYRTGTAHECRKVNGVWKRKGEHKEGRSYPLTPSVVSLIASLSSDAQCGIGTFTEFCDDLGYDEDSRTAERVYHACRDVRSDLLRIGFDLDLLADNFQDY